jgi:hypothetical protein
VFLKAQLNFGMPTTNRAWEKEAIRQKRIAYDLRRIKDDVVSDLVRKHEMIPSAVAGELRTTFGRYFMFALWVIIALGALITRWAINGTVSGSKTASSPLAGLLDLS